MLVSRRDPKNKALQCLRAEDLYLTAAMVVHSVPHWFPAVSPACQIPPLTKMEVEMVSLSFLLPDNLSSIYALSAITSLLTYAETI